MKFHGIDMQGRYLVEEAASPIFVDPADDRRLVRDTDTPGNDLLIGNETQFDTIITSANIGDYSSEFGSDFHPKNGNATEDMQALIYTGDDGVHMRTSDKWFKISNGTPIASTDTSAGIKVEQGAVGNDNEDARLYYYIADGLTPSVLDGWYIYDPVNMGITPEKIASETWVNGQISGEISDGTYNKAYLDSSFVRKTADISGTPTIDEDWVALIPKPGYGELAADRFYYTKSECYNGFVRTDGVNFDDVDSPDGAPLYVQQSTSAHTVPKRDGAGNLYCNLLYGTATQAQYADLAEKYTCDETLPIGTVVGVMPDSEYEVEPFTFDFMHGVIGVVSENPAYLMNSESDGLPIALTGKVPVRVVGEVKKGDFLVPVEGGLARKGDPGSAIDRDIKFATVLTTDLQVGEKLVECIVK